MIELSFPFAMAGGWRWRGSEVPGQKSGFATIAAACSTLAVMPDGPIGWVSTAIDAAGFWAAWRVGIAQPWPRTLDMGRTDGTLAGDMARHSLTVAGMVAPAVGVATASLAYPAWKAGAGLADAALAGLPGLLLLPAAALAGPAYALGWRLFDRWPVLRDPTRIGDLLAGLALGSALLAIGLVR